MFLAIQTHFSRRFLLTVDCRCADGSAWPLCAGRIQANGPERWPMGTNEDIIAAIGGGDMPGGDIRQRLLRVPGSTDAIIMSVAGQGEGVCLRRGPPRERMGC